MIETLKSQIRVVVAARQRAQEASGAKASAQAEWENQNRTLFDEVIATAQQANDAEATLRELTLQAYATTGNKAPVPGVGIREMTKLEYDNGVAFNWAKEHAIALKLDVSAFEKIAKVSPPDFVEVSLKAQAIIATHLEEIK